MTACERETPRSRRRPAVARAAPRGARAGGAAGRAAGRPSRGPHGAFPFLLAAFALWAAAMLLRCASAARPHARRARPRRAVRRPRGDHRAHVRVRRPVLRDRDGVLRAAGARGDTAAPRLTAGWALGSIAAFVALSVVHPTAGESEATERMISQVVYLAWIGAAATLVSAVLHRRDAAIARLATQREQLAAQALAAEQRERRRLAQLLHDESVQTLSLARQELADYHRTGRDDAYERARRRARRDARAAARRDLRAASRTCSTTRACRPRCARSPTARPSAWARRSPWRSIPPPPGATTS